MQKKHKNVIGSSDSSDVMSGRSFQQETFEKPANDDDFDRKLNEFLHHKSFGIFGTFLLMTRQQDKILFSTLLIIYFLDH